MNGFDKNYFPDFDLINTLVLVKSDYLLERGTVSAGSTPATSPAPGAKSSAPSSRKKKNPYILPG